MPDDLGKFDPYHKWLGIPPEERPAHHYRLLAVNLFEDDPDVIENAADQRTAYVRTFAAGRHARFAHRLLNEISAARLCLQDRVRKAAYDDNLRSQLARAAARRSSQAPTGAGSSQGSRTAAPRLAPASAERLAASSGDSSIDSTVLPDGLPAVAAVGLPDNESLTAPRRRWK